ncbi:MAG: hypothetical protein JNM68_00175 [Dinghuibacter sp.]|nr:hypothetical protein [Dinghuibacter sp.]
MYFEPEQFYHIYNRGNDKQAIFLEEKNYAYFLEKMQHFVFPHCTLLAWCLMPNHFHFLVYTSSSSCGYLARPGLPVQQLVEGIRLGLSAYTKGFNKAYNKTGNLFQQKTKAKQLDMESEYPLNAFHYIHQNPLAAGLVDTPNGWKYSSYSEYFDDATQRYCNLEVAEQLLGVDHTQLVEGVKGNCGINMKEIF